MRPELDRLRRIEQHLLGTLSPEQAADWNLRLLLDSELSTDADAQRLVYEGLRAAGRRQLRHELSFIHQKLYGGRRTGFVAGLRAVLARWRR